MNASILRRLALLGGFLAVVCMLHTAGPAWADYLDTELQRQSRQIVKHLKAAGYHDVGILRFRTKLPGHKDATFASGPINVNLAERLEAALVLSVTPADNLRVLHDAGTVVAARGQHLSYLRTADRDKMFNFTYPVAWGADKVQPDAFLTGYVEIKKIGKKASATATIIVMGRGKKALELPSFPLRVDSALLAEAGVARKRGDATSDFDDPTDPKEDPKTDDPKKTETKKTEPKDPGKTELSAKTPLVELLVQYGSAKEMVPAPHGTKPGWEKVPDPKKAGEDVTCWVKNLSSEPVAMVLKMNGLNTLDYETADIDKCRMWVLDPGKQFAIWHYSKGNEKADPFKTVSDEDWEVTQTNVPVPGQIELAVFVPRPKTQIPPKIAEPTGNDEEMKISQRAISRSLDVTARRSLTLSQLQSILGTKNLGELKRSLNTNKASLRGGIVADPKAQFDLVLERQPFPDAIKAEHRFIEYWAPPTK